MSSGTVSSLLQLQVHVFSRRMKWEEPAGTLEVESLALFFFWFPKACVKYNTAIHPPSSVGKEATFAMLAWVF